MSLSKEATNELRTILHHDIGDDVEELTQNELEQFGDLVLTIVATSLKISNRQQ